MPARHQTSPILPHFFQSQNSTRWKFFNSQEVNENAKYGEYATFWPIYFCHTSQDDGAKWLPLAGLKHSDRLRRLWLWGVPPIPPVPVVPLASLVTQLVLGVTQRSASGWVDWCHSSQLNPLASSPHLLSRLTRSHFGGTRRALSARGRGQANGDISSRPCRLVSFLPAGSIDAFSLCRDKACLVR